MFVSTSGRAKGTLREKGKHRGLRAARTWSRAGHLAQRAAHLRAPDATQRCLHLQKRLPGQDRERLLQALDLLFTACFLLRITHDLKICGVCFLQCQVERSRQKQSEANTYVMIIETTIHSDSALDERSTVLSTLSDGNTYSLRPSSAYGIYVLIQRQNEIQFCCQQ